MGAIIIVGLFLYWWGLVILFRKKIWQGKPRRIKVLSGSVLILLILAPISDFLYMYIAYEYACIKVSEYSFPMTLSERKAFFARNRSGCYSECVDMLRDEIVSSYITYSDYLDPEKNPDFQYKYVSFTFEDLNSKNCDLAKDAKFGGRPLFFIAADEVNKCLVASGIDKLPDNLSTRYSNGKVPAFLIDVPFVKRELVDNKGQIVATFTHLVSSRMNFTPEITFTPIGFCSSRFNVRNWIVEVLSHQFGEK